MAKVGSHGWEFDREPQLFDEPRGTGNGPYELAECVESIGLKTTSNYAMLQHVLAHLPAAVLEAPGNGNLRTDEESIMHLREAARAARGPVVVVGAAIQNADVDERVNTLEWADAVYNGDPTTIPIDIQRKLIPGGAMTDSEARILMAELMAKANREQMVSIDQICEMVAEGIRSYPFLAKDSTHVKERKRKRRA